LIQGRPPARNLDSKNFLLRFECCVDALSLRLLQQPVDSDDPQSPKRRTIPETSASPRCSRHSPAPACPKALRAQLACAAAREPSDHHLLGDDDIGGTGGTRGESARPGATARESAFLALGRCGGDPVARRRCGAAGGRPGAARRLARGRLGFWLGAWRARMSQG